MIWSCFFVQKLEILPVEVKKNTDYAIYIDRRHIDEYIDFESTNSVS